jgi:hypothetical protein
MSDRGCGRRDTRPIEQAWQREKPVKMMNFLTFGAREGHVDIVPARPYLCRIVSTAMAFILLAFLPLNLGLPVSHSIGG